MKKTVLTLMLICLGLVTIQCSGGGIATGEDLTALLTFRDSYQLDNADIIQAAQDLEKLCGTPLPEGAIVVPPEDAAKISFSIRFQPSTYELTVTVDGKKSKPSAGTWKAIDNDTLEITDAQDDTSSRVDVHIQGDVLHIQVNSEDKEFDCSPSPESGSASTSVPSAPLGATAQALQGTWCYYQGFPYYLGLTVKEQSFRAAYVYDNTDLGNIVFQDITGSISEETASSTVSLINDSKVDLTGLDNPATLLWNGTSHDYIKIKYAQGKFGFFKRSASNNECPGLTVPSTSLAGLPAPL